MKLISWNVNGIRSVHTKGFLRWFENEAADIVCIQETKAHPDQLTAEGFLNPLGYHSVWHSAEKRGYSGVAVYSKKEPIAVQQGLGFGEFDSEGRVLQLEYPGFVLLNCYFPNSQRDHARLDYKLKFCKTVLKHLEDLRKKGKNVVICGDFNIAHKEIDLRNPKQNEKNAGFLPEEREWMTGFIAKNYVDAFREFEKGPNHYTWWSYRPGVREKNIGWRLDYFFVSAELRDRLKSAAIHPMVTGSDHCPVSLQFKK